MRKHTMGRVSKQTQRFVLRAVYDFGGWRGINATQAANLMDMPQATADRAFDELGAIEPGWIFEADMVRRLHPGASRKEFLRKVSPFLFNPVVREYRLDQIPTAYGRMPLSGLSAVGHYSKLDIAPFPTFAVTKEQERELKLNEGKGLSDWDRWDRPACTVQVMRYQLDSMNEAAVDPISAILSLSDEEMVSPRIEQAAAGILERVLFD